MTKSTNQEIVWLRPNEASAKFKIAVKTLRRWGNEEKVTVLMTPGGHRRYSLQSLESIFKQREAK